jgi:hypothetical protein
MGRAKSKNWACAVLLWLIGVPVNVAKFVLRHPEAEAEDTGKTISPYPYKR